MFNLSDSFTNWSNCFHIKLWRSSIWKRFNNTIFRSNPSVIWSNDNLILSSYHPWYYPINPVFCFCFPIKTLPWYTELLFKSSFFKLFSFTACNNWSNFSFFWSISFPNYPHYYPTLFSAILQLIYSSQKILQNQN